MHANVDHPSVMLRCLHIFGHSVEILQDFDWHCFDSKGRPDVRMAYIQFALSFLMYGDTATLVHVLDTKGIIYFM